MTAKTDGVYDRTPLIAGNWKMNLDHLEAVTLVQKLSWTLSDADHDFERVEVAVFPPFTDLRSVQTLVAADRLPLVYGGQDLSPETSGAYTGDISGQFLSKLGCTYVLVGHSERRTIHAESDEVVQRKVTAALEHGLGPILCVGEGLEVRQAGQHVEHTLGQMRAAVDGLSADQVADLVVAYEPVWAIGTGEVAGPEDAQEMCRALRAELEDLYDADTASRVRLLYGGSVKSGNVASILRERDVDGVLVGGASLEVDEFASIVRFEHHLLTD
ncbi:triose-phosphate isomerase [Micrococcus terreus]|uniref:triose-phosphate isomerase n=1 Tax=Micrococcus terreus TaxID=574650 RepID=UPI0023F9F81E|nr:triose-phosphate isomerase [Micrococcus terreus]MDK7699856.1 triose-phosphate isomerase [Micrococcus terreus]WOO98250.1 triose-phosphate isomerase [Micrococcus terreus]